MAVAAEVERIQLCAHIISVIDALQSLAEVAEKQNYTKPVDDEGDIIEHQRRASSCGGKSHGRTVYLQ